MVLISDGITVYFRQSSRDTGTDEYEDISLSSGDEIDSEEPGYDKTTTQEHRVRFDKNGKIEKVKQVTARRLTYSTS